jgi:N-acetylneuraminate synthase
MSTNAPVFVAEFTTNHLGNLNVLMRMVDAAAAAGCDFIKMQKKDVRTFYAPEKLDAPYTSPYGHTYGDYRMTFEFGPDDYRRLSERCHERGIRWFSTIQDIPSLYFMLPYDLPMYKIASCNLRNTALIAELAASVPPDRPIVVSTGGATLHEIESALGLLCDFHIFLLHTVSEYPCAENRLKLGNLAALYHLFGSDRITIGYSGHETGWVPTLAAIELGAKMIERHFCLSRHSFVHHIECSLEPDEYASLVKRATSASERAASCSALSADAFRCDFRMTETERLFLVEQRYGNAFLHAASSFDA